MSGDEYRDARGAKLYAFTGTATADDRRRLLAMSTQEQTRQLLQVLPAEFSTAHVIARVFQQDPQGMRQFIQNAARQGLVERAGKANRRTMIWRKTTAHTG